MSKENILEQNLELLAKTQPQLAVKLPFIDGELTKETLQSAKKLLAALDLKDRQVIYVLGVGQGYLYEACKGWLREDKKRALVFFENRLGVLRQLLESKDVGEMLRDEQVRIFPLNDPEQDNELFNWICWDYLNQPFVVTAQEEYKKGETFEQLQDRLIYEHHRREEIVQEYLDYGIIFYQNFYANLLHLHKASLGNKLFGKFKNVPAIICGAGPSLQKNIDLLKNIEDRALIFAGGSAINALTKKGILPTFGCGIDPNYDQYVRLVSQKAFKIPFFYRQRMHHKAFQTMQGPKLYITGTGGYETARYFEEKLGIEEKFIDEGHNVVNFCTSIAHALGCNPIIFVGLDLAFTDMRLYAEGVLKSAQVDEAKILEEDGINHAAIKRTDIYGKPIYTLWKWIAEAEWTAEFATEHSDVKLINATEGGLGIEGVPNELLADVIKRHMKKKGDLKARVQKEIAQAALPKKAKKVIREALDDLRSSLERCQQHADVMLKEIGSLKRRAKKTGKEVHSGALVVAEMDLKEEIAYPFVLEIFNGLMDQMTNKDVRRLERNAGHLSPAELQIQSLDIEKRRYTFLKRTAKVNVDLIDYALQSNSDFSTQRRKDAKKKKER